jgi:hypothetical protein
MLSYTAVPVDHGSIIPYCPEINGRAFGCVCPIKLSKHLLGGRHVKLSADDRVSQWRLSLSNIPHQPITSKPKTVWDFYQGLYAIIGVEVIWSIFAKQFRQTQYGPVVINLRYKQLELLKCPNGQQYKRIQHKI